MGDHINPILICGHLSLHPPNLSFVAQNLNPQMTSRHLIWCPIDPATVKGTLKPHCEKRPVNLTRVSTGYHLHLSEFWIFNLALLCPTLLHIHANLHFSSPVWVGFAFWFEKQSLLYSELGQRGPGVILHETAQLASFNCLPVNAPNKYAL